MFPAAFGCILLMVSGLNPSPGLQRSFIVFRMTGKWQDRAGHWFSDLSGRQNRLEGLQTAFLCFTLGVLTQRVWGGAQEFVIPACSRVMPGLLTAGAHFEDHWSRHRRSFTL